MLPIYLILVAFFLFKVASSINHKLEKGVYYKGITLAFSFVAFIASIVSCFFV